AAPAKITIVATENFYGDVIGQIAGDHVSITSIISDPNADPHTYESSTRDMAAIGRARLVVINGLGYDGFMSKLIKATPNPDRVVMVVSEVTGRQQLNWHLWYDPTMMQAFAHIVAAFLVKIDPPNAKSYQNRLRLFDTSYKPLSAKVAEMRATHPGTVVGSTEPIFINMAAALNWKIATSSVFMKAIEDGGDPPARAIAEMQDQIHKRQIKVLIYNVQTISPVTERIRKDAAAAGVPVVGVSETLPPGLDYQHWMRKQLNEVEAAVNK
ncbi:MAG TPA: zinc ABC transporter substrate-binding protein, partial [bacterium]|nr:zinc ABC transporter substrate-binding protein [bacterium]